MANDFLPSGYEQPKGNANYLKFETGENKFRILSKPLVGWLDWTADKKPVRTPMDKKPSAPIDPKQPIKHFWALVVWSYKNEAIQVLEITQGGIITAVKNLAEDADWGSPYTYDLKVTKTGSNMETKYSVTPSPKTELSDYAKECYKAAKVDLNALMTNGDPFANSLPAPAKPNAVAETPDISSEEVESDGLPF